MNEGQWSWMRSVVVELSGELKSVVVRSGGCNSGGGQWLLMKV